MYLRRNKIAKNEIPNNISVYGFTIATEIATAIPLKRPPITRRMEGYNKKSITA